MPWHSDSSWQSVSHSALNSKAARCNEFSLDPSTFLQPPSPTYFQANSAGVVVVVVVVDVVVVVMIGAVVVVVVVVDDVAAAHVCGHANSTAGCWQS